MGIAKSILTGVGVGVGSVLGLARAAGWRPTIGRSAVAIGLATAATAQALGG